MHIATIRMDSCQVNPGLTLANLFRSKGVSMLRLILAFSFLDLSAIEASDWHCTYGQNYVDATLEESSNKLKLKFDDGETVEGTALKRTSEDRKYVEYEMYYGGIQLYSYFLKVWPDSPNKAEFRFCWDCAIYKCEPR